MASADGNTPPPTSAMETAPAMCSAGCGFFGNSNTGGMCSKCYKETLAKSAAPAAAASTPTAASAPATSSATAPADSVAAATPAPAVAPPSPAAASPAAAAPAQSKADTTPAAAAVSVTTSRPVTDEPTDEEPPKKKQINTNRCWTCNKKIGLTGFQCKCEYYFCATHRYSDKHECAFDFKAFGKQQLTKANPTIAPSKLATM